MLGVHAETVHLVDERGYTVDMRSRGGIVSAPGVVVAFPCHVPCIEGETRCGGGTSGAGEGGSAADGEINPGWKSVSALLLPPTYLIFFRILRLLLSQQASAVREVMEIGEEKLLRLVGRDAR